MSLLPILHYPDPGLRKKAEPIRVIDESIRRLADDMFETMYAASGIGLAATQVDVPKRLIVLDVAQEGSRPYCLINPEIVYRAGHVKMEEGCLSVPDIRENVVRAERIRLKALDREGRPLTLEADDLLAVCIQHEVDHLNGKLFVDHLSGLKRDRIRSKAGKYRRQSLREAKAANPARGKSS